MFGWQLRRADLLALLLLGLAALAGLMLGYAQPAPLRVDVAGRYNLPYLQNFHEPEALAGATTPSYRWTRDESTIALTGLGRGVWQTKLRLGSPQPGTSPKQVLIEAGAHTLPVQLQGQARDYLLLTPSTGDLDITLQANAAPVGSDPRPLGVTFGGVTVDPVVVRALPPLSMLLSALIALALAFMALRLIGVPTWLAAIGPLLGIALLSAAVALNRAPQGILLPRLAILSIFALLGTIALILAWRGLVALGRLDPAPWLLPALLATFQIGFWIKAGGLLYPYSASIDVGWHVRDIQLVLDGRWRDFYLPSFFSYGKMPVGEWGTNPPLLPYTPFFHIIAAPLAIFPWPMAHSVNVFSIFFDTNRVILIAALALAFGLRSRAALLAALLYAITPFTFLLHSWGNMPTTFGIFWLLLTTTVLALTYGRWHERRILIANTLLLLGSFLFYFVMAVFGAVFAILLWIAIRFWQRDKRQARSLLIATCAGAALSIAIYYIFFIPEMWERTLPYVTNTVVGGGVNEGQADHQTLAEYFGFYVPHLGYTNYPVRYGMWLPILIGLPALWLFRRNRFALSVLGAWIVVAILFLFVGLRVSMVDKHVFYVAPALAITTAALFDRLWDRNLALRFAILGVYAFTLVSAIDIWILRLQRVG